MVRRRQRERSLFEVLLPDAEDKLWPACLDVQGRNDALDEDARAERARRATRDAFCLTMALCGRRSC